MPICFGGQKPAMLAQTLSRKFLKSLRRNPQLAIISLSILAHALLLTMLGARSSEEIAQQAPVKIRVVEKKPPKPPPEVKKQPKPRKQPTKKKKSPAPKKNTKKPKPVMGLDPSALSKTPTNFQAPAGNTLMKEDDGTRLRPEQIQQLDADMSADARLIRETLRKPQYSEDAIDAELEGTYVIDVFVTSEGKVQGAELRTKIGYNMDQRVLRSIREAQFIPRKNPVGKPIAGWTSLNINLTLD